MTLPVIFVKIRIDMNENLLKSIGLTESQSHTYAVLVEAGSLTPPQLAQKTGEGRTAAYMALGKLEELGLAKEIEGKGTKTYEPVSPSALSGVIEKQRQELDVKDELYRNSLSELLSHYFDKQTKPGVRFYSGADGLHEIYNDHLKTEADLYLVRTAADEEHFGKELYEYMGKRAECGITTHALLPLDPGARDWAKQHDGELMRKSSWYPVRAYTAPVEIAAYGNKVSFISFGDETVGTILESPQIAAAIKQLIGMARVGARELIKP